MPVLTLTSRAQCSLCRGRIRGVYVAQFRINKGSLRSNDRGGLLALDPRCPECGFEAASVLGGGERWTLTPDAQERVDAFRARKGWAA